MAAGDSYNLIIIARFKRALGITGSGDDTLLDELGEAAEVWVDNYLGRSLAIETHTEYHDGMGRGHGDLVLLHRPVSSVTTLHDDVDRDFASADLISSDDYYLDGARGIIRLLPSFAGLTGAGHFTRGVANLKVVYEAGYNQQDSGTDPEVPADLAMAIMEVGRALYSDVDNQNEMAVRTNYGEYSVEWVLDRLLPNTRRTLGLYRQVRSFSL